MILHHSGPRKCDRFETDPITLFRLAESSERCERAAVAMISSPPASEQPDKAETAAALLLRSHLPPYLPNREFDVYVADGAAFPDLVEGGRVTEKCIVLQTYLIYLKYPWTRYNFSG